MIERTFQHISKESLDEADQQSFLVSLAWSKEWPHIESVHQSLCHALAATCVLGLKISRKLEWLQASVLALRLHTSDQRPEGEFKTLRELVLSLPAEDNSRLFWAADALVRSIHEIEDPWMRLAEVTMHDSPIELKAERVEHYLSGAVSLHVEFLDLRPRLPLEKNS